MKLYVLLLLPLTLWATELPSGAPEKFGLDPGILADMTQDIVHKKAPVYSVLVSRRGTLVYEMYTHNLSRNHSHYLMSVTKSVTATLVGIAIDKGHLQSVDQNLASVFPAKLFPSPDAQRRFHGIKISHVLAMSALDAQVPPHHNTPQAEQRNTDFHSDPDRVRFALSQKLLANPGSDFQYQDITPSLAIGMITVTSGQSSWDFARRNLFDPLGFINTEWMHADASGQDLGGFGLRLRPVDMQKYGILHLNGGVYNGKRLLSTEWMKLISRPQVKSSPDLAQPNYGYFFWYPYFYNNPQSLMASGWRGQYILTIPDKQLVITMTGCFLDGRENDFFIRMVNDYILRAADAPPSRAGAARLRTALARARKASPVDFKAIEPRMVPTLKPMENTGHAFFP